MNKQAKLGFTVFTIFSVIAIAIFAYLVSAAITINPITVAGQKYVDLAVMNGANEVARFKLVDDDAGCFVNCSAIINISNKISASLPNSFDFKDNKGNLKSKPFQVYYLNYTILNVSSPITAVNCTNVSLPACQPFINGTRYSTRNITQWIAYTGQTFPAGNYTFKITSSRDINEALDWAFGYNTVANDEIRQYWAWWNSTWNNYTELNIKELSGVTQGNYSIKLTVPYNPSMMSNFSDLRFIASDNVTQLCHWKSKGETYVGVNSSIFLFVPALAANSNITVYMYYGNPTASESSNMSCAFMMADDFDDSSINTNLWTASNTVTEANGNINVTGTGTPSWIRSVGQYNISRFELVGKRFRTAQSANGQFFSYYNGTTQRSAANCLAMYHNAATEIILAYSSTCAGTLYLNSPRPTMNQNTYYIERLRVNQTEVDYDITNGTIFNGTYRSIDQTVISPTNPPVPSSKGVVEAYVDQSGGGSDIYDFIYLRPFISPEPTVTFLTNATNTPESVPVTVTFNSQVPPDVSTTNVLNGMLNISYNFTNGTTDYWNFSSVRLWTKVNTSTSDCIGSFNGTQKCNYAGWGYLTTSGNQSPIYYFALDDNEIYPAVYNYPDHSYMEFATKLNFNANNPNNLARANFVNMTNTTLYNDLEVNLQNVTSTSSSASVWYCNSTYTTGSITTSPNCVQVATIANTQVANHTHGTNSQHYIIPFVIINGKVSNTTVVTQDNSFIIRGNNGGWNVRYIANKTRVNAAQTSTNLGGAWSELTGTFDMHFHQYTGNETLYYFASAQNSTGTWVNSTERSDLLNLGGLPPTAPVVYSPTATTYVGLVNINYTAAISPNAYNISYYNITLLNSDTTYNSTIKANNSMNLSYVWNSSAFIGLGSGSFFIRVTAYDQNGLTSFGESSQFTVNSEFDVVYPIFSGEATTANGTIYAPSNNYAFSINITNTNGTAGLEFGGINYTLANSSNVYQVILTGLSAGNYNYFYWSYGNGTLRNFNKTATNVYSIVQASTTPTLLINGTTANMNITYPSKVNATASCSITNVLLLLNGANVTSQNGLFQDLGVGYYNVTTNCLGDVNYSASTISYFVNISKATPTLSLSVSPSSVILNGTQSTVTGSGCLSSFTCSLFRNGVGVSNPDVQTLDIGNYTYVYNTTGNENYSIATTTAYLNITPLPPSDYPQYSNLVVSPTSPQTYSPSTTYTFNSTWTDLGGNGTLTVKLNFGGVNYTATNSSFVYSYSLNGIAAGTWNYYWYAEDNGGNSNITSVQTYTVNKANPSLSLSVSPSNSIINGTQSNVSGSGCPDASCVLRRNGIITSNPDVSTLPIGTYNYNYSYAGSVNYNPYSVTSTLGVALQTYGGLNGTINFTGTNLSQTINFQVPYSFVTRAYMNLSGDAYGQTNCYQETANKSEASDGSCNLNYTGVYNINNGFININYSVPKNIANATVNYRIGVVTNPIMNTSIFGTCINSSSIKLQLKLRSYAGVLGGISTNNASIECYNLTNNWQMIYLYNSSTLGSGGNNGQTKEIYDGDWTSRGAYDYDEFAWSNSNTFGSLYEESVTWQVSSYPYGLNASISNSQFFYYPTTFTQSNNRTSNFYSILNNYLSSCTYIGGICIVPINFTSTTQGAVRYSDVMIDNYGFIEGDWSYNQNTTETQQENFSLNISYDRTAFSMTAALVWNGTEYPASTTNFTMYNSTLFRSLTIPSGAGLKNIYWKVGLTNASGTTYFNSTVKTQNVNLLNMSLCRATPYNVPFLNFTFHNETLANEAVKASFSGTFTYWLSNQSVNKTYTFVNATENSNYAFCFSPNTTQVYTSASIDYYNSYSQQRSFTNTSMLLSSTLTTKDLLLLPDTSGIYITFLVQNAFTQKISGALIDIKKTSGNIPVEQKYTDGTGTAAFWLSTSTSYTITVTKSGYEVYSTGINPSTSPVTITLTASSSGGGSGGGYVHDDAITIKTAPTKTILDNDTAYDFVFNISSPSSATNDFDEYGFYLYNGTSYLGISATDDAAHGSYLSVPFNTGSQNMIEMRYYYILNGVTYNGSKRWAVENTDGTDYSILHGLGTVDRFTSNTSTGIFGLKRGDGKTDFAFAILIFTMMLFITGAVSYKFGISSVTGIIFIVFSVVMFFDVGANLLPQVSPIPHALTILTAIILIGSLIREVVD